MMRREREAERRTTGKRRESIARLFRRALVFAVASGQCHMWLSIMVGGIKMERAIEDTCGQKEG